MATLIEKVYMAKLAVLISIPSMLTTHCAASAFEEKAEYSGDVAAAAAGRETFLHGVVRSERRTPFSRASCSRVTGMKLPIPQTTKTYNQSMVVSEIDFKVVVR